MSGSASEEDRCRTWIARADPLGDGDEPLDRGVLGDAGTGLEVVRVLGSALVRGGVQLVRVLGVHDEESAEPGDLGHRGGELVLVQLGELVHAGGREEALEAVDACVVQRLEVLHVVGQGPAPEADVDVRLAAGDVLLGAQVVHRRRGRQGVEGHVDEGGDAAGGRGAGGGPEALPLGAARVVHVDVRVDQAGQQGVVAEVLDAGTGRHGGVVRVRRPRSVRRRRRPRRPAFRPG